MFVLFECSKSSLSFTPKPKQITKNKYNQKPTYETLRRSLEAMKAHCLENGVTRLSIPRYGVFFAFHWLTLNLLNTEYPLEIPLYKESEQIIFSIYYTFEYIFGALGLAVVWTDWFGRMCLWSLKKSSSTQM